MFTPTFDGDRAALTIDRLVLRLDQATFNHVRSDITNGTPLTKTVAACHRCVGKDNPCDRCSCQNLGGLTADVAPTVQVSVKTSEVCISVDSFGDRIIAIFA